MWGYNHLIFLPSIWTVIYIIIAAVSLALPFMPFAREWGESIGKAFCRIFFESPRRYIHRLIFTALMATLFIIFPMKTHFLGDGYAVLANIGSESSAFVKWSEKGITLILLSIQSLLGPKNQETALMSFRVVSITAGMVTVWFFFLISEILSEEKTKRLLTFAISFLSAILLLFFGYVENYPLIWVGLTGFIYYGMSFLKKDRGLVLAGVFLAFGLFIHLQMAIFVPAFIYVTLCKGGGLSIFRRFRPFFIGLGTILFIGAIASFIKEYRSNLYFENIFLPLFHGKPIDPAYAIFSMPHLVDILNMMMLLFPSLFPLLVLARARAGRPVQPLGNKIIFLALIASAGLAFLFIIDPTLGMPRDWDLFSVCGYGFCLLIILAIPIKMGRKVMRMIPTLVLFCGIASFPFLAANLTTHGAVEYIKDLINLDKRKSGSSWFVLYQYYLKNGSIYLADSLMTSYKDGTYSEAKIADALSALNVNDVNRARQIISTIPPDKFSWKWHYIKCLMYFGDAAYDKAMAEANYAIQLERYIYRLYWMRGKIYAMLNQKEKTLEDFRHGYQLNSQGPEILAGLAAYFDFEGRADSCILYSEQLLSTDSSNFVAYYYLARSFNLLNKTPLAKTNAQKYEQFGRSDPLFESRRIELSVIIDRSEQNPK